MWDSVWKSYKMVVEKIVYGSLRLTKIESGLGLGYHLNYFSPLCDVYELYCGVGVMMVMLQVL